uniref:Uncharacterized protein n=1 Tax=Rhizophagus irregularis (strain DAOM 181602 / DAOM 197198 / MUCL 43194) TaxID=747089 RepID=U9UKB0_RHIID
MSSSNNKKTNFSLASYEPLKLYPQLDRHSDSRRNIPEGGLAKDNVLGTNIKPQDNDSDEEDNSSADNGRDDTSENSYRDWYIENLIDEHYGKGASKYIDAVSLLQDTTI